MCKIEKGILLLVIGISYLSRVQASVANAAIGNRMPSNYVKMSSSTPPVADAIFMERIKSRVKHWKNACGQSSTRKDGMENGVTFL